LNHLRAGVLLLVLASIGFASLSVLTKLAYSEGGTVLSVLVFKNSLAAVVFVPAAIATVERTAIWERMRTWLAVALLYAVGNAALFSAIKFGKVSEVAPIFYLFPGIVILIERFVYQETLGLRGILAIAVGVSGSILVIGQGLARPTTVLGSSLALLSAMAIAAQYVVAAHKVRSGDQLPTAASMMTLSAVVLAAVVVVVGVPVPTTRGWILLGLIAVVGTAVPVPYLVGLSRAGASRAALVGVCEPLFIVVLALLVLRESIGLVQGAGIGLILASFIVAATWMTTDPQQVGRGIPVSQSPP
jgi:drug/metabolite transporter (DMT)-like permease